MHFHALRKELAEISELARLRCARQLKSRGWIRPRARIPRHTRVEFEQMLALPVREARYMMIDTETTGFEPYGGDAIIQVALIEYRGLEPTGVEWASLVNPRRPISETSRAIHGIDDDMVRDAPLIDDIVADITGFIDEAVIIGHHVAFDLRFLQRATRRVLLRDLPNPRMDTVMLHLAAGGSRRGIGLDRVAAELGIVPELRHDARGDARSCGRIFARLAAQLSTCETTVGELLERVHPLAGLPIHHPAEAEARIIAGA